MAYTPPSAGDAQEAYKRALKQAAAQEKAANSDSNIIHENISGYMQKVAAGDAAQLGEAKGGITAANDALSNLLRKTHEDAVSKVTRDQSKLGTQRWGASGTASAGRFSESQGAAQGAAASSYLDQFAANQASLNPLFRNLNHQQKLASRKEQEDARTEAENSAYGALQTAKQYQNAYGGGSGFRPYSFTPYTNAKSALKTPLGAKLGASAGGAGGTNIKKSPAYIAAMARAVQKAKDKKMSIKRGGKGKVGYPAEPQLGGGWRVN